MTGKLQSASEAVHLLACTAGLPLPRAVIDADNVQVSADEITHSPQAHLPGL